MVLAAFAAAVVLLYLKQRAAQRCPTACAPLPAGMLGSPRQRWASAGGAAHGYRTKRHASDADLIEGGGARLVKSPPVSPRAAATGVRPMPQAARRGAPLVRKARIRG